MFFWCRDRSETCLYWISLSDNRTKYYRIDFRICSPIPILYPEDMKLIFPSLSDIITSGKLDCVGSFILTYFLKKSRWSSKLNRVLDGSPFMLRGSERPDFVWERNRKVPPQASSSVLSSGRSLIICLVGSFSGSIHIITIPLSFEHACEVLFNGNRELICWRSILPRIFFSETSFLIFTSRVLC
jgi:hypothetical protein